MPGRTGEIVVLYRVADHVAPTVDPQQRGAGRVGGPIQPHTDARCQRQHLDILGLTPALQLHQRAVSGSVFGVTNVRGANRAIRRRSG